MAQGNTLSHELYNLLDDTLVKAYFVETAHEQTNKTAKKKTKKHVFTRRMFPMYQKTG